MLAWVYQRFFEHIEVDPAWVAAVRDAQSRGTVVYVMRNLSFVDFLALDYLTKRFSLPQVRFANDLGLSVFEPMGRGWFQAFKRKAPAADIEDFKRGLREGLSAALFLKRPPALFDGSTRGQVEGDGYLRALFEVQREQEQPILAMPQTFIWSKEAEAVEHNIFDAMFGPREWPGKARTIAQFLANYRNVTLRAGKPVDVRAFLAKEGHTADDAREPVADQVLVRRITYTLLRRLERERRAVLGPTKKPPDRFQDEVLRSPKLKKVITDMAGEGADERAALAQRATSMLREMGASLDVNSIAWMNALFEQITSRMYRGIEVDTSGLDRLRELAKEGTLVLLPSHKSHLDYLVLVHLFYRQRLQLPMIAAGDNLSFFPLGPLFRRGGAFFIRRNFRGDKLYAAVVDAYIRHLIKDGWSIEVFIEGGRSRTGKLLPPKLGLLTMMVDAAMGTQRKSFFCPISIGYERVVEEESLARELAGAEKKKEDVKGLLGTLNLMVGHYGRLNVQFGNPLTIEQIARELDPQSQFEPSKLPPSRRRALITRLAYRVMNEINRVTAVTPGSLVAMALLAHDHRGVSHAELVDLCDRLAVRLQEQEARFVPSLVDLSGRHPVRREALREACELFIRAGNVEAHRPGAPAVAGVSRAAADDAIYVVPERARMRLDLSKNIIIHFFVGRALCAVAVASPDRAAVPLDVVRERVRTLSRLFKYEFLFRADAPFEKIFEDELTAMIAEGELVREGDAISIGLDEAGANVALYAGLIRNFIEGYRVAARSLSVLIRGPLTPKELTKRAITVGERMFLGGEIRRREAVSRPLFENAFSAFVDQGYLVREEGKLRLTDSFSNMAAVRAIEGKVAGLLERGVVDGT